MMGGSRYSGTNRQALASTYAAMVVVAPTGGDDTAMLQAAIDSAKTSSSILFLRPGVYSISGELVCSNRGQVIQGSGAFDTIIKQTGTATALRVTHDASPHSVQGSGTQHVRIENLRVEGPGRATSLGAGIHAEDTANVFDWFQLSNVTVHGFDVGVLLDGPAQVQMSSCLVSWCRINIKCDATLSATNTIQLLNTACAQASEIGLLFADGQGCSVIGGDFGAQPVHISIPGNAQVTMIGQNMENVTAGGVCSVDIANSGRVTAIGQGFVKSVGLDVPQYRIDQNGGLVCISPFRGGGYAATTPLVYKTVSTAVVQVLGITASLSFPLLISENAGTTYAHGQFPQRVDNAMPAAASTVRGLILQVMGRDVATAMDRLWWYFRDRTAGSDRHLRGFVPVVLENAGTPEAALAAGPGVFCRDTSAGTLYWKATGTGNTGWVALH